MLKISSVVVLLSICMLLCGGCSGTARISIERKRYAPGLDEFPVVVVFLSGDAWSHSHGFERDGKTWKGIFKAEKFISQWRSHWEGEKGRVYFFSSPDEEFIAQQPRFLRVEFHEEKTWIIPRLNPRLHWYTDMVNHVNIRLFDTNVSTPFALINVDFSGNAPIWGHFPFDWKDICRNVMIAYKEMESEHEEKRAFFIKE